VRARVEPTGRFLERAPTRHCRIHCPNRCRETAESLPRNGRPGNYSAEPPPAGPVHYALLRIVRNRFVRRPGTNIASWRLALCIALRPVALRRGCGGVLQFPSRPGVYLRNCGCWFVFTLIPHFLVIAAMTQPTGLPMAPVREASRRASQGPPAAPQACLHPRERLWPTARVPTPCEGSPAARSCSWRCRPVLGRNRQRRMCPRSRGLVPEVRPGTQPRPLVRC
jgi:hypothetical protein